MPFRRTNSKVALLEKIPLFKELSRKQVEQIARLADEVDVSAGKRLATAGDTGHELFVIIEGQAAVSLGEHRMDSSKRSRKDLYFHRYLSKSGIRLSRFVALRDGMG